MPSISSKDCAIRLQSFSSCTRVIPTHLIHNALHHTQDGKTYLRAYTPGPNQRVQLLELVHPFILSQHCNEYKLVCIHSKVSITQAR